MLMLDLSGFLVVLMLSVIAAILLHYVFHYYVVPGPWSFVSKVIIGFLGGVFGPMFLGRWLPEVAGVPLVPTLMGSLALIILVVDTTHSLHTKAHS